MVLVKVKVWLIGRATHTHHAVEEGLVCGAFRDVRVLLLVFNVGVLVLVVGHASVNHSCRVGVVLVGSFRHLLHALVEVYVELLAVSALLALALIEVEILILWAGDALAFTASIEWLLQRTLFGSFDGLLGLDVVDHLFRTAFVDDPVPIAHVRIIFGFLCLLFA